VSGPQLPDAGRWAGIGDAIRRAMLVTGAAAVAVGGAGALIGWADHRGVARTVAMAYYLVGSLVFLVGVVPTGGYSLLRGTITRRRPTGARNVLIIVVGVALFALGLFVDLARPV
jgi:hypothetical protein